MTKDKLLGLKLKQKTVNIEGTTVIIKEMTAGEGTEYENSLYELRGNKVVANMENARAKLIQLTCYDEQGNKLFEKRDMEQVKLLPNRVASVLFSEASDINGLSKSGSIDIESAKKN